MANGNCWQLRAQRIEWLILIALLSACASKARTGSLQGAENAAAGRGPDPAGGGSNAGTGPVAGAAGSGAAGSASNGSISGSNGSAGMGGAGSGVANVDASSAQAGVGGEGSDAGTSAAGTAGEAGSGGEGDAAVDPPARVPVFQQTRCIDPSKVVAGSEIDFPCDGVEIWVVVPSQCMAKPCGLVFNIHGGGMNDHATMDQATNMIALGTAADYIVVHPHKGTWSVASDKNVVFDFMQQAIEAFDVDRKRVHSTGYSQGGQISWALGCEHADVIASIAPAEEINRVSDCWKTSKLPARALSVLFAYGKQDSIGGGYDAAEADVAKFVTAHGLAGPETIAGSDGAKYWRQRWTGASGNVLEFIAQNYSSTGVGGILAGHCLPMATGDTFVSCSQPVDYDWGKEVIAFFQAHPMP